MADPRTTRLEGQGQLNLSFKADGSTIVYDATKSGGSAQVNKAVTVLANGTIALTSDASAVLGKLLTVEADGTATVAAKGVLTFAFGTASTSGLGIVGAANGDVRAVNPAVPAELAVSRGITLLGGATTSVPVLL